MSIYQIFQNEINRNYKNSYIIKNAIIHDNELIITITNEILDNSKYNILAHINNLVNNPTVNIICNNFTDFCIINDIKELKLNGCKFTKNNINDIYIEHLDLIKRDLNSIIYYNFY